VASFRLADLAVVVGGAVNGDGDEMIYGVASIQSAQHGQVCFLDNPKYRQHLATTHASAVVLAPDFLERCPTSSIVVNNPYLAYAKIAECYQVRERVPVGHHPSAVIDPTAELADDVRIGAHVVIGPRCQIHAGVEIYPGCVIGASSIIGAGSLLHPNVTLYENIVIGERVTIHSGAVIGADGFGLAQDKGVWRNIPQLGRVLIGDDTDVGANTTIDRGALEDTVIGKGVKLDNLIQIAHNVVIGDHTAIAGCAGISGSTQIGKNCIIGGGAGIAGHLTITDNVVITGMAGVSRSINEPGMYSSGTSVQPNREWRKNSARFHQLDAMARRLRDLEKQVAGLNPIRDREHE